MKRRTISTLIFLSTVLTNSYGQNFTPIAINNAQGVYNGEVVWVDFDNDNDLDFIITGQSNTNDLHTRIYQNNGNDTFELYTVLGGYSETGLELMNLNGDQFIDLVINGRKIGAGSDPTSVYSNNNTSFEIQNSNIDFLLGGTYASVTARDWNNDLKEDIIISGINGFVDGNPNIETILYTRDQNNDFISSSPITGGAYLSGLELFDIDNDMDLDLIISGNNGDFPYQRTDVYLNENNTFILSNIALEQLQNTSLDVGDYNSDGYLDVILTGYNEFLRDTTLLYKNVGGDLIVIENSGLNGHVGRSGSVQWGDYDNDGDLDLLFNGESSNEWSFEIMINNGNDQFSHLDEVNFQNLAYGSASWGDYDNDGDLDVLTTGYVDVNNPQLIIYKNNLATPNTPPTSPPNLTTNSFEMNNVDISWESSFDNETNFNALTYNLHVEDAESNTIFSSYANLESGFLKRVWEGNVGLSNTWQFKGLENGQYYAYVQSIDAGYKASLFSDPSTFYIGLPNPPQSLSLNEIDHLQLLWEDISNNEEFFIIERKLGADVMLVKFDSVTTDIVSFTDEKLPPSFSVEYRAQASNPNGVSDYSSIVSSIIDGTPTELNISLPTGGTSINWTDNAINEEFFIIERKLGAEEIFVKFDSVTTNTVSFIDEKLPPSFTVNYQIQASNLYGVSDYSSIASSTINGTPTELSLSMVSNGVKLGWIDNSITEEYFIIERKLSGSDTFEKIDSVSSNITEFVDTNNLEDEIIYRIYSKNELGISDYSEEASIVILATDSEQLNNFKIYPNPFKESFTISTKDFNLKDSEIKIFNSEGKSIPFSVEAINENNITIILNDLSRTYFVNIENGNKILSFKIFKN
ncbi:MAG: FG-GAP-like repeat-containing protein [Cyclobacteriaceae bacterium]|nr:FG-GAP-like repeat-containing protein [Cyclobacteriaceae bacterium]